MAFDENPGTNKLANVLSARMKQENYGPMVLDFGEIDANYGLTTNTFPKTIPKSDYSVCRNLSGVSLNTSGGQHGGHESGNGSHSHSVPMLKLQPGNRVLVAWIGAEAVVIDVITSAGNL